MKQRTLIGIAAIAAIAVIAIVSYNLFSSSAPAPQVTAKAPTVTLTEVPTQAQTGTGEVVLVDDGGISERINAAFESIKTIEAQGQAVNEEIAKLKSDVAALKTRTYKLDTKKLSDLSAAKPSAQVAPVPPMQKETPATPAVSQKKEEAPAESVKQDVPAEPAASQVQESAPAPLTPPPYINGGQKLGQWDALSKDERAQLVVSLCNGNVSQKDAKGAYAPMGYDEVVAALADECGVEAPAPKETKVAGGYLRAEVRMGGRLNNRERMYEGDEQLMKLNSLGPRGRVIQDRRAPADAIPCIVKGVRGMCVPR